MPKANSKKIDWAKLNSIIKEKHTTFEKVSLDMGRCRSWLTNVKRDDKWMENHEIKHLCLVLNCPDDAFLFEKAKKTTIDNPDNAQLDRIEKTVDDCLEYIDQYGGKLEMLKILLFGAEGERDIVTDVIETKNICGSILSGIIDISDSIETLKVSNAKSNPLSTPIAYLRTRFLFHETVSSRVIQNDIKMLQNLGADIDMRRTQLAAAELMIDTQYARQGENLWKKPDIWQLEKRRSRE